MLGKICWCLWSDVVVDDTMFDAAGEIVVWDYQDYFIKILPLMAGHWDGPAQSRALCVVWAGWALPPSARLTWFVLAPSPHLTSPHLTVFLRTGPVGETRPAWRVYLSVYYSSFTFYILVCEVMIVGGGCWCPGSPVPATTTISLLPGKLHFLAGSEILLRHSETGVACCTELYTDTHYTMELYWYFALIHHHINHTSRI